ncbi:MAG: 3-methyladenine glycosylase [Mycobacterium sp.]|nr:3-methyladenine glycosylase [Mycobacterium sp.]
MWRTACTPEGAGTLRLTVAASGVLAEAWGPGAEWLVAGAPALCGAEDRPEALTPLLDGGFPLVTELARRLGGLRLARTGLLLEMLVPAVLEQKVTGVEAHRSWAALVRAYGSPAPGPAPAGMAVAPPAAVWRRIPSWAWHRAGVDAKRSAAILRAAAVAHRLEPLAACADGTEVERLLRTVPGIGVWTAAEVRQRCHGDPDAPSVGDYHVPAMVGWALLGRPVDDAGMLALLERYRGQRQRVVRLLELGGPGKPRFGPRRTIPDMRRF